MREQQIHDDWRSAFVTDDALEIITNVADEPDCDGFLVVRTVIDYAFAPFPAGAILSLVSPDSREYGGRVVRVTTEAGGNATVVSILNSAGIRRPGIAEAEAVGVVAAMRFAAAIRNAPTQERDAALDLVRGLLRATLRDVDAVDAVDASTGARG
jgi:hypothetical protein